MSPGFFLRNLFASSFAFQSNFVSPSTQYSILEWMNSDLSLPRDGKDLSPTVNHVPQWRNLISHYWQQSKLEDVALSCDRMLVPLGGLLCEVSFFFFQKRGVVFSAEFCTFNRSTLQSIALKQKLNVFFVKNLNGFVDRCCVDFPPWLPARENPWVCPEEEIARLSDLKPGQVVSQTMVIVFLYRLFLAYFWLLRHRDLRF